MEFNNIEYFLAIARHRSISGAAKELYISQPALSKYLNNLEKRLGVVLFNRSRRNLTPTASGACLISHAVNIYENKRKCLNELQIIKQSDTDTLSIGFATNGLRKLLPQAIKNFEANQPDVELKIVECRSWSIEDKIANNDIDLGFISLPTPRPDLESEVILEEYVLLAVPASNRLCNFGTHIFGCEHPWIDIKHFKDSLFVLQNEDTRFRRLTDSICNRYGLTPKEAIATHNKLTAMEFAEQLGLVCFTTDYFINTVQSKEPHTRYYAIGDPIEKASTCIAYKSRAKLSKQAREFIITLKQLI